MEGLSLGCAVCWRVAPRLRKHWRWPHVGRAQRWTNWCGTYMGAIMRDLGFQAGLWPPGRINMIIRSPGTSFLYWVVILYVSWPKWPSHLPPMQGLISCLSSLTLYELTIARNEGWELRISSNIWPIPYVSIDWNHMLPFFSSPYWCRHVMERLQGINRETEYILTWHPPPPLDSLQNARVYVVFLLI